MSGSHLGAQTTAAAAVALSDRRLGQMTRTDGGGHLLDGGLSLAVAPSTSPDAHY